MLDVVGHHRRIRGEEENPKVSIGKGGESAALGRVHSGV